MCSMITATFIKTQPYTWGKTKKMKKTKNPVA